MNSEFGKQTIPHIDLLFTYALLITGENRQAEKILLQTFAKAYGLWTHLSEETDVKLWLIGTMMNIIRSNPGYGESLNNQILQNKTIDLASIDIPDFDEEFDYQKTKHLHQIISSLPLMLKEVIIFVDVFKFGYELVAGLVEVTEDVVRKRLFDSRKEILFGWLQNKSKELSLGDKEIYLKDIILIIKSIENKEVDEPQNEKVNSLKNEIEGQNFVKNIIAKNISIQPVREAIKIKLVNRYAPQLRDEIEKTPSPEKRSVVRVATFTMIVLITILILLFRPTQENPAEYAAQQLGEDNILVQLKNNYSLYIDGKFNNDLIDGDEKIIKNFLSSAGIKYKSILPKFAGWNVERLFLTSYKEQQLINLVYKNDFGNKFYLYHTPELMDYLESNNCYSSRNGKILYILKKTEGHIVGFVLDDTKKELIIEICSKSYISLF
jgi:RNA polymerase sigma-70 factor (ECF subfamily)